MNATSGETAGINTNTNRFSENVTAYDKNGNIKTLQRYGQTAASGYGLIDNLTFTLGGNLLNRVDDAAAASAYGGGFEFKDGVKQRHLLAGSLPTVFKSALSFPPGKELLRKRICGM